MTIQIKNLTVSIENKEVLKNINVEFKSGVNIIVGPNGAGKSSLLNVIAGNPAYSALSGEIILNGENIMDLSPDIRSKKGIFLGFQNPPQISGMPNVFFISEFIKCMKSEENLSSAKIISMIKNIVKETGLSNHLIDAKDVNQSFSGGQKKQNELLQMIIADPKVIILDEIDSGLDIDGKKTALKIIQDQCKKNKIIIVVTHDNDFAKDLKPAAVHAIIQKNKIIQGDIKLIDSIKEYGFKKFKDEK